MATFFGEILPVTSRAVDDDEDEDEIPFESTCFVQWSPNIKEEIARSPDGKLKCSTFIVAVGPAAMGFTQTYVTHDKYDTLGEVFSVRKSEDGQPCNESVSTNDKTCTIHRSRDDPNVIVCQCNDILQELCYAWVQEVMGAVCLTDCCVPILCSFMTSHYRSDVPMSEMSPPFLRGLKTSNCDGPLASKLLEQPNMVTGLPAQVMSYCQIHDVKSVMYISYTDCIFLELATITVFKPVLKTAPFKNIVKVNPDCQKTLLQIVDQHTSRNTQLYL